MRTVQWPVTYFPRLASHTAHSGTIICTPEITWHQDTVTNSARFKGRNAW